MFTDSFTRCSWAHEWICFIQSCCEPQFIWYCHVDVAQGPLQCKKVTKSTFWASCPWVQFTYYFLMPCFGSVVSCFILYDLFSCILLCFNLLQSLLFLPTFLWMPYLFHLSLIIVHSLVWLSMCFPLSIGPCPCVHGYFLKFGFQCLRLDVLWYWSIRVSMVTEWMLLFNIIFRRTQTGIDIARMEKRCENGCLQCYTDKLSRSILLKSSLPHSKCLLFLSNWPQNTIRFLFTTTHTCPKHSSEWSYFFF